MVPLRDQMRPVTFKKFLDRIMVIEVLPEKKAFCIRLLGEKARHILGFDARGFDINKMAPEEQVPARLDRQNAYHNQPCGRVDHMQLVYVDGTVAHLELTYLPLLGKDGERLLLCLIVELECPEMLMLLDQAMMSARYIKEDMIDIGAGVPNFRDDVSHFTLAGD